MKKLILFTSLGIILDQVIKYSIDVLMNLYSSVIIISNFFSLTYVRNYGAAFNILDGNRIFFIIVALTALTLIYQMFLKGKNLNKLEIATYSLLLSGIIGNLIDRVIRGFVIDYLDFTLLGYSYPVFNVADICIVVSVVLLIIMIIKEEKNGKIRNNRK